MTQQFSRRDVLLAAAAGLAASGSGSWVLAAQEDSPAGIPKRPLGNTGEKVSLIGLGGWHIASIPQSESIRLMHEAIDQGITFFDNAWDYHDGAAETVMGKALADGGRRDKIFLMTKVCDRDYAGVKKQIDQSLHRLQTDRIDLLQFHEINYLSDPDWVFDKGGLRAALEARKAGKIRFIGFTGHKDISFLLAMLKKPFDWATAQMPINVHDAHYRSFQKEVLPACAKRKIGVIGMKSLACGILPKEAGLGARLCRRYALSLPISTLVCGIASRENLQQDLAVGRNFKPMTAAEIQQLLAETQEVGSQGKFEPFKTEKRFDGEYHRRQHEA